MLIKSVFAHRVQFKYGRATIVRLPKQLVTTAQAIPRSLLPQALHRVAGATGRNYWQHENQALEAWQITLYSRGTVYLETRFSFRLATRMPQRALSVAL